MNDVDWEAYAAARNLGRNRLIFKHHQEVLADFLQFFSQLSTNLSVLDVGCSAGFFLVLLRELGFRHLRGIDVSEQYVRAAQLKGLSCSVGDLLTGAAADPGLGKVDVVLLMDVLEHLPDPVAGLRNCRELLAGQGMVYLTVPIYDSLTERVERIVRRKSRLEQAREHDPTHLHGFSEGDLHRLLREAGLQPIESRRLYCPIPNLGSAIAMHLAGALVLSRWKGKFLRIAARRANP